MMEIRFNTVTVHLSLAIRELSVRIMISLAHVTFDGKIFKNAWDYWKVFIFYSLFVTVVCGSKCYIYLLQKLLDRVEKLSYHMTNVEV